MAKVSAAKQKRLDAADKARWTPITKGPVYCSPACGFGCTKAAHDRAYREANLCLNKLSGAGWVIRVWENMGWYWEVSRGVIHVRRLGQVSTRSPGYVADLHTVFQRDLTVRAYANPQVAVDRALNYGRKELVRLTKQLAEAAGGKLL